MLKYPLKFIGTYLNSQMFLPIRILFVELHVQFCCTQIVTICIIQVSAFYRVKIVRPHTQAHPVLFT